MKERFLTAAALVVVFLGAIFLGKEALSVLLLGVMLVGAYEIYRLKRDELHPIMMIIIMVLGGIGSFINFEWLPFYFMLMIMLLFSLTVVFEWFKFEHVSYIFILLSMLILAMHAALDVYTIDRMVFFFVLVATYSTDAFAFFGGMLFGKHKLIERISPKKTVEGAVVGYLASAIISLFVGFLFMGSYLSMNVIIGSALLIPAMGQFGDLAFSLVKRSFGVKDFGFIFPGHGGVLDRIDSVIFALFTFSILLGIFG